MIAGVMSASMEGRLSVSPVWAQMIWYLWTTSTRCFGSGYVSQEIRHSVDEAFAEMQADIFQPPSIWGKPRQIACIRDSKDRGACDRHHAVSTRYFTLSHPLPHTCLYVFRDPSYSSCAYTLLPVFDRLSDSMPTSCSSAGKQTIDNAWSPPAVPRHTLQE